jgi:hypothetical protein
VLFKHLNNKSSYIITTQYIIRCAILYIHSTTLANLLLLCCKAINYSRYRAIFAKLNTANMTGLVNTIIIALVPISSNRAGTMARGEGWSEGYGDQLYASCSQVCSSKCGSDNRLEGSFSKRHCITVFPVSLTWQSPCWKKKKRWDAKQDRREGRRTPPWPGILVIVDNARQRKQHVTQRKHNATQRKHNGNTTETQQTASTILSGCRWKV